MISIYLLVINHELYLRDQVNAFRNGGVFHTCKQVIKTIKIVSLLLLLFTKSLRQYVIQIDSTYENMQKLLKFNVFEGDWNFYLEILSREK